MTVRVLCVAFFVSLVGAGCQNPIGVDRTNDERWFRTASLSALTGPRLSDFAQRKLGRRDLEKEFQRQPIDVIRQLQDELQERPSRNLASVIAELAYLRGKRLTDTSDDAARLYGTALLYAYAYLFDQRLGPPADVYNPRFRMACDLYNRSLAKLVRYSDQQDVPWGEPFPIHSLAGDVIVDDGERVLFWEAGAFHSFCTVYEFEVRGLKNKYRTPGLGVPLILLRKPPAPGDRLPIDRFLNQQSDQAYMATAVVRIRGSVLDDGPKYADYSLYDPLKVSRVRIGQDDIPLETDVTTPLAYALEHAPPVSGLTGLLDVEAWDEMRGLYILSPYDPDKIPVVFIHGLMSSPLTWLPAINDVLGDQDLREHYQVWYFMYPTGNPIVYSASVLRESLKEAQALFDPEGDDPAFSEMVLVGHSMGGLLTRMVISHGDGSLWDAVAKVPISELNVDEEIKSFLHNLIFFEPMSFIKRAVFVAVPHRGSELAGEWYSDVASSMVRLPDALVKVDGMVHNELRRSGADKGEHHGATTAIDDLSPTSPDIEFISNLTIAPEVSVHSIIANHERANTPGGTDTVVTYDSSHLETAESELIVKGTHRCSRHPLVIREIRRILRVHAEEYGREGNSGKEQRME